MREEAFRPPKLPEIFTPEEAEAEVFSLFASRDVGRDVGWREEGLAEGALDAGRVCGLDDAEASGRLFTLAGRVAKSRFCKLVEKALFSTLTSEIGAASREKWAGTSAGGASTGAR